MHVCMIGWVHTFLEHKPKQCNNDNNVFIQDYLINFSECIECLLSKDVVDVPVGQPVVLGEDGSVWHRVEEGPEGGVTAPVVVQLVVLLGEVHRNNLRTTNYTSYS